MLNQSLAFSFEVGAILQWMYTACLLLLPMLHAMDGADSWLRHVLGCDRPAARETKAGSVFYGAACCWPMGGVQLGAKGCVRKPAYQLVKAV
jgi:hypothetical protein